jgi:vacuolar-type H+-ATPase subunit D/Vma8
MPTVLREWPNVYGDLRNNLAEMIRAVIAENQKITENKVNNEEDIEAIAALTIADLNVMLRALERAGASTDPLIELQNRVHQIKGQFTPSLSRKYDKVPSLSGSGVRR